MPFKSLIQRPVNYWLQSPGRIEVERHDLFHGDHDEIVIVRADPVVRRCRAVPGVLADVCIRIPIGISHSHAEAQTEARAMLVSPLADQIGNAAAGS